MASTNPGLTPGENKPVEVVTNAVSDRQPDVVDRTSEQPSAQASVQVTSEESTVQPTQTQQSETQEQPAESRRAQERIQALDRAKNEAEARANYFQQLAQNMANVQPARPSQQEVLSKQFASFDPTLGYPTDGKEYAQYVALQAMSTAQQAAQETTLRNEEARQIAEFKSLYPEQDDAFIGAVAGIRQAAQRKGSPMTYAQAAKQYTEDLQKRYAERVKQDVASGETERVESYVESGAGGASMSRKGDTMPEFKNVGDMERYLKEHGAWDE